MRRFVLLILIFSLMLTLPAMAENTVSAVEINWNQDVINAMVEAGIDGNMATVTLKDGKQFEMMIPDGFVQRELTEDETQKNVILAFVNEETATSFQITDSTIEGAADVSYLAQARLALNPDTAMTFAVINGTTALISGLQEQNSINIAFDLGESRFVQIVFAPLEGNNVLAQYLAASVQF